MESLTKMEAELRRLGAIEQRLIERRDLILSRIRDMGTIRQLAVVRFSPLVVELDKQQDLATAELGLIESILSGGVDACPVGRQLTPHD